MNDDSQICKKYPWWRFIKRYIQKTVREEIQCAIKPVKEEIKPTEIKPIFPAKEKPISIYPEEPLIRRVNNWMLRRELTQIELDIFDNWIKTQGVLFNRTRNVNLFENYKYDILACIEDFGVRVKSTFGGTNPVGKEFQCTTIRLDTFSLTNWSFQLDGNYIPQTSGVFSLPYNPDRELAILIIGFTANYKSNVAEHSSMDYIKFTLTGNVTKEVWISTSANIINSEIPLFMLDIPIYLLPGSDINIDIKTFDVPFMPSHNVEPIGITFATKIRAEYDDFGRQ